jgi:hypothetical protein
VAGCTSCPPSSAALACSLGGRGTAKNCNHRTKPELPRTQAGVADEMEIRRSALLEAVATRSCSKLLRAQDDLSVLPHVSHY